MSIIENGSVSAGARRSLGLALRIAAGLCVLGLVVWYAEPRALLQKLGAADIRLFALACLVAIAANLVSATRWAVIARALGLNAPTLSLVPMYARGITTNMLLPGATLSGDLLRSYQLSGLGNPFLRSALSVFFDRFSGLWVLCVLSLFAVVALGATGALASGEFAVGVAVYAAFLVGIVAAPTIPWPTAWLRRFGSRWARRLAEGIDALRERLRSARPAMMRSIWLSVAVQALSAFTLWLCGLAVGATLSYWAVLAAAAPIFIMGALPLGIAGFGTRELGAVIALGFLGVPSDLATAMSVLYGLTAVVQGVIASPFFLVKDRSGEPPVRHAGVRHPERE